MFLRIFKGIRDHFDARVTEWAMAATATYWGWTVAQPGIAWPNEAAWAGMTRLRGEDDWGLLCMLCGGLWIIALAVNGTFANTAYSRFSPWVRGLMAAGSMIFWFEVLISVSAVQTAGSGIYPLPLFLSGWCVRNAWSDIGAERRARNAKHRGS